MERRRGKLSRGVCAGQRLCIQNNDALQRIGDVEFEI